MMESARTPFVFIPGAGGMAWYWHRVVGFANLGRRARRGRDPEVLKGGHLAALSNPRGIVETLLRFDEE